MGLVKNKGNFQPTDESKSKGSVLYHPFQSFINKVKILITKYLKLKELTANDG